MSFIYIFKLLVIKLKNFVKNLYPVFTTEQNFHEDLYISPI
jgi:hypothetical protein